MIPYRLLLVSDPIPESPAGIHCSNQMIGYALWTEFKKLPHVTFEHQRSDPKSTHEEWREGLLNQSRSDFTLVHSYAPGAIFNELDVLKRRSKYELMWISELPHGVFDYNFTFLPTRGVRGEQMPLPALRSALDESMVGVQKIKNSVLLDHHWSWSGDYAINRNPNLWCQRLYDWLEPMKDWIHVGQMESVNHEAASGVPIPDWVHRVPNAFYPEYLRSTAPYENFVMTHPGTYEHSTVDMLARGIRVLVPVPTVSHKHKDGWEIIQGGSTFAPLDTVSRFNLPLFSNREGFLTLLDTPFDGSSWGNQCTDAPQMAAQIDAHCQRVLNGRGR